MINLDKRPDRLQQIREELTLCIFRLRRSPALPPVKMKTVKGPPAITLAGAASGATARLANYLLLEDDAVILKQEKHIQV